METTLSAQAVRLQRQSDRVGGCQCRMREAPAAEKRTARTGSGRCLRTGVCRCMFSNGCSPAHPCLEREKHRCRASTMDRMAQTCCSADCGGIALDCVSSNSRIGPAAAMFRCMVGGVGLRLEKEEGPSGPSCVATL